jgi:hypothetical protein
VLRAVGIKYFMKVFSRARVTSREAAAPRNFF